MVLCLFTVETEGNLPVKGGRKRHCRGSDQWDPFIGRAEQDINEVGVIVLDDVQKGFDDPINDTKSKADESMACPCIIEEESCNENLKTCVTKPQQG